MPASPLDKILDEDRISFTTEHGRRRWRAREKGLIDPVDELAALIAKDDPTPADVERIGRLLSE